MSQLKYGDSLIKKERIDVRGQWVILSQTVNRKNRTSNIDVEKAVRHLKNKVLA